MSSFCGWFTTWGRLEINRFRSAGGGQHRVRDTASLPGQVIVVVLMEIFLEEGDVDGFRVGHDPALV